MKWTLARPGTSFRACPACFRAPAPKAPRLERAWHRTRERIAEAGVLHFLFIANSSSIPVCERQSTALPSPGSTTARLRAWAPGTPTVPLAIHSTILKIAGRKLRFGTSANFASPVRAISFTISLFLASAAIHAARLPSRPLCPFAIVPAAPPPTVPPIERFVHARDGGSFCLSKRSRLQIQPLVIEGILGRVSCIVIDLSPHETSRLLDLVDTVLSLLKESFQTIRFRGFALFDHTDFGIGHIDTSVIDVTMHQVAVATQHALAISA